MNFQGFKPKFTSKEDIEYWAGRYGADDEQFFQAGKKLREGDFSLSNLKIIVAWKSVRRIDLINKNTDYEIADALRLALEAKEPRSAMAVLVGLQGVGEPMASSILTAIDPEKYTVIDYRALEALGVTVPNNYFEFYLLHYLTECKRLASEAGVSLRELDRALWQWSVENSKATVADS